MSKFQEWLKSYYIKHGFISSEAEMKAARNAATQNAAEICKRSKELELAEAIEREKEE